MNNNAEANLFFMKPQDIILGWVAQNFQAKSPADAGLFAKILHKQSCLCHREISSI
jgi:hypothetical protein